jgi:hypothetical protein
MIEQAAYGDCLVMPRRWLEWCLGTGSGWAARHCPWSWLVRGSVTNAMKFFRICSIPSGMEVLPDRSRELEHAHDSGAAPLSRQSQTLTGEARAAARLPPISAN